MSEKINPLAAVYDRRDNDLGRVCHNCGSELILDPRPVPAIHRYGRELTQSVILKCERCGAEFIEMQGQPVDLSPKITAEEKSDPPKPLSHAELLAKAALDFPHLFASNSQPSTLN